jgi:hypothetical protein
MDTVIERDITQMLFYDWYNADKQKIFYKDHVVRCRLRRRRRRSRPPTEAILKENHRKDLDANLKACSRSRSQKIKEIISVRLLQNTSYIIHIT